MANVVERQILVDGPRKMVVALYFKSDGATGDLDQEVLVTPADAGLGEDGRFAIVKIWYNFAGFDAVLEFDAGGVDANWKWVLTEGTNTPANFESIGGLQDNSNALDRTGNLTISTTGFTSSQDQGSMVLVLNKKS